MDRACFCRGVVFRGVPGIHNILIVLCPRCAKTPPIPPARVGRHLGLGIKQKIPGVPAGAVGCRIQDPGSRGYRWLKKQTFRTARAQRTVRPHMVPVPALNLTTSLRGDFGHVTPFVHISSICHKKACRGDGRGAPKGKRAIDFSRKYWNTTAAAVAANMPPPHIP